MDTEEQIITTNSFDNLVISFSLPTLRKLLKLGANEALLYTFYCVAAKQQSTHSHTNILNVYATDGYCMQGLGWGKEKFYTAKKNLITANLIKSIIRRDKKTNSILGHYIRINYVWKTDHDMIEDDTENTRRVHSPTNPDGGFTQRVGFPNTNTSNLNINTSNLNINTMDEVLKTNSDSFVPVGSSSSDLSKIPTEHKLSSKNSLQPLTELEVWQMAKDLDVTVYVVQATSVAFWDWIELPNKRKKYTSSYKTIRNWVQRRLDKGEVQHNNETQKLQLETDHPEVKRNWNELRQIAKKNGWIE